MGELADQQRRDYVRPQRPLPCPGWVGLLAPSGVFVIGVALVLRDFVQRHLGRDWTITAILAGAALSAIVAPPPLVHCHLRAVGTGRHGGVYAIA